tara:strand:+ start:1442 stop:1975 length:534 start_codon:yes stop_codon:yes gene_type:complete
MPHTPNHGPCTYQDFAWHAKVIVGPAYYGLNGGILGPYASTYMTYFANNYYTWLDNMWNTYSNNGCQMFQNRYTHWQNQLAGPPPITNAYHIARKKAKMLWAQTMHTICGCPGPVPMIVGGNVAKIAGSTDVKHDDHHAELGKNTRSAIGNTRIKQNTNRTNPTTPRNTTRNTGSGY